MITVDLTGPRLQVLKLGSQVHELLMTSGYRVRRYDFPQEPVEINKEGVDATIYLNERKEEV